LFLYVERGPLVSMTFGFFAVFISLAETEST
jgi:hypothetical protein